MNIKKIKQNGLKNLQIHLEHMSANEEVYNTSYSLINPTMTKYNCNLCLFDMINKFEEIKEQAYARTGETVVALSLIVTLPKDYEGDPKEFFEFIMEEFQKIPELKHCIAAYVHYDESNPHMHYVFCPLEEQEKIVQKREKVYDEKKEKYVTRKVEHKYKYCFNAKKLINKDFLENLHPEIQKRCDERGIKATIITPERVAFNKWKEERLLEAKKQIELHPEDKENIINEFWKEWQQMNPHDYKRKNKNKPKDFRLTMFEDMVKKAYEEEYKRIEAEKQRELESFKAEQQKVVETEKTMIFNSADKEIDDYIIQINEAVANREKELEAQKKERLKKYKEQQEKEFEEAKRELDATQKELNEMIENLNQLNEQKKEIDESINEIIADVENGKITNPEVAEKLKYKVINNPTKEEYNELINITKNVYTKAEIINGRLTRLEDKYNNLVDEWNKREDEIQSIVDDITDKYENKIEGIKAQFEAKIEQLKNIFYKALSFFGINRPFEHMKENDKLRSLDEQVRQNSLYYEYGKNAMTAPSSSSGIRKNPEHFKDNDKPELVR